MKFRVMISCMFLLIISTAYGADTDEPPKAGNFILPGTQEPGPLIGFGENILNKNQTQLYLSTLDLIGTDQYVTNISPALLYGLTDSFSIYFNLPIASSLKSGPHYSSGLQDASVQFEYAFYASSTHYFTQQATFVTNATIPTGSSAQQPPTGFGSPSFFLGTTYNQTYTDWFMFTAQGAVLTTSANNTKYGDQFLYQAGIGRNIMDIDSKWIVAWLIEADGQYNEKNKLNGAIDANSGGNTVYVTPSLWISSKYIVIHPGIGFPVVQNLFGNQLQNHLLLALSVGWSFY